MEKLGYEICAYEILPFLPGEDMVTMRAVSRFWNELVAPIPLVRAFARSRLKMPRSIPPGLCARCDCTY